MPNPAGAVELVKKAAIEAVEAQKPVQLLFGTVLSAVPLSIQADQRAVYTERMLALAQRVTDHELELTISGETKRVTVRGALRPGDRVLLARMQRGKKFLVLDRLKEG